MEQDRPFPFALILAAHGERRANADNAGVARLAGNLAAAGVAKEVGFGFIKGSPSIDEAIRALSSRHVVVYPLFLADGYFTRVVLPRLVEQAIQKDVARTTRILPPIGLEPALADLIVDEAVAAAHSRAISPTEMIVVLLAHAPRMTRDHGLPLSYWPIACGNVRAFGIFGLLFSRRHPR